LGARLDGIEEVAGSNPAGSTNIPVHEVAPVPNDFGRPKLKIRQFSFKTLKMGDLTPVLSGYLLWRTFLLCSET
jgi:hypothetical protein